MKDPIPIPYVNLAGQHAPLKQELLDAVGRVIDSGRFILGNEVSELEARFAELCGVPFAVAVNSGTDALVLALKALDIGPGDEVITAPNSFIASASCIVLAGARPVFVDVRDDYNIDPSLIEAAITPRTKAIIPVHLTGRPAEMDSIMEIAGRRGLQVIEDCAQAVCAEYKGRRVGSLGRTGCFSLHPLKTLNACGDGGIVTTRDESLAERIRILRNLGQADRYTCVEWSGNSRLDTLQAAMLLVKLKYVGPWTEKRRANAAFYCERLGDIGGVRVVKDQPSLKSVYHTFVIQAQQRDELKNYLEKSGIGTGIHYPVAIHLQKAAENLGYKPGSFPVAERQAKQILSLPVYPELEPEQLHYVAEKIKRFYGTQGHDR